MAAERDRTAELAVQAGASKNLIDRMEGRSPVRTAAADEARGHETPQARATRGALRRRRSAIRRGSPPKSPSPRPEASAPARQRRIARDFNAADGYGGTTRGISITTRPEGRAFHHRPTAGSLSPGRSAPTDNS